MFENRNQDPTDFTTDHAVTFHQAGFVSPVRPEFRLSRYDFETVKLDETGRELTRERNEAFYFTEVLAKDAPLDTVAIPGGRFLMGAPETEENRSPRERGQRQVAIAPFYISKYPITQIQWNAVAKLPKVNRPLPLKPSLFKGYARPVENVSWYEAVEFCDRLSLKTGRLYRLPSEAEWEYACRGGTTTPFYCGDSLTTNLANCDGRTPYGNTRLGRFRGRTTVVGSFLPNPFGLYDMVGNVWEWCADLWHHSTDGAPADGRIWVSGGDETSRPLRGGSWMFFPGYCRSATRIHYSPEFRSYNVGFRVVCGAAKVG
ncbi:hypothetical protein AY599_21695 [Leptolyngbya valderiana BDU 20041]|nr:hypothetical protein AY599_21695 [Leptolyngbya valderiana BDU 20041]